MLFDEEMFNEALIESIVKSGIFGINEKDHKYRITAEMTHWFQPPFAFTLHTDFRVKYTIENDSGIIFQKELESNSVATVGEAFSGAKRVKIGLERAMQNNIEMFLTELSGVDFK